MTIIKCNTEDSRTTVAFSFLKASLYFVSAELQRTLGNETEDTDDDTTRYVVSSVHRRHDNNVASPARHITPRSASAGLGRPTKGRLPRMTDGRPRRNGIGCPRLADVSVSTVRARRRSVKMLFAVVLEFFLCWTPLYVLQTWSVFDYPGAVTSVSAMSMNLIHLLAFVSSCCNPITYCFMSKRFRQSFLTVFYSCCRPLAARSYHRCRCSYVRSATWQSGCTIHRAVSNYRTTEF